MKYEDAFELLELGIASTDTRGGPMGFEDEEGTWQPPATGLVAD